MMPGKTRNEFTSINWGFGLLYFALAKMAAKLVLYFITKQHENISFLLADP